MAKTQAEILEGYRTKVFKLSKSDFAHELGTSRQSYHLWLAETSIAYETLSEWAIRNVGGWLGVMAVELICERGLPLPCVCLEEVGDNGRCPKHGVAPLSREARGTSPQTDPSLSLGTSLGGEKRKVEA